MSLPIDFIRSKFDAALAAGHVVVESPTGSGKSTRLPVWCAEHGRVLVVEPRRLACRSLARHVANLRGTTLGEGIGYAVRFDSRFNAESRVVFATPGVALRWFAESGLADFSVVMLDEFHERRWDTDLLAALLRQRKNHHLVLTSATVDSQRLSDYLGAVRLQAEGRLFPVELRYAEELELPRLRDLEKRIANAVVDAYHGTDTGDILVFLPGRGEIRAAHKALEGRLDVEIIPLHASVESDVQDRALAAANHRRVILATNVAETSLTIPGVRMVVDSGLERRTHHRNGRTVLGLHPVSHAAAEQRRGRAGRLGPGLCLRLWGRQARLEAFTAPEIAREELTDLFLAAAASGTPALRLEFPDALPEHVVQRAIAKLEAMGAVDTHGLLTPHGKRLAPLPLDPLFAHLITAMPDDDTCAAMVDLAAALTADRALLRPIRRPEEAVALTEWIPVECDATTLITLIRRDPPTALGVDRQALSQARLIADQTRAALDLPHRRDDAPLPREAWLAAVIAAVPELAFVRRNKRRHALGNGESEVEIGRISRFSEDAEAAVVFDQHSIPGKGTLQTINIATCLAPLRLEALAGLNLGEVVYTSPNWDGQRVVVRAERTYGGRSIQTEEMEPCGAALRQALTTLILDRALKAPAGERLKAEVAAWNLYVHLGHGSDKPVDQEEWLAQRLATLGVERSEDMALIEPQDLTFDGIPEWERPTFDRNYPRHLQLENLPVTVTYEPGLKRITLERRGGTRRSVPMRKELPAWSGWTVRYKDGSRVVPIK